MQYTKPMIDLVYEIRRRVDSALKPSVKMANPEMLNELAEHYFHTKDTVAKALIKELLFMAGPQWHQLIEPTKTEEPVEIPKQVVKVYRGQTILTDTVSATENTAKSIKESEQRSELLLKDLPAAAAPKPVRMYRGHPVL